MNPVKQTILHDPENGNYGDCFRACIASLMEMNIDEVPHFMDQLNDDEGKIGIKRVCDWLKQKGYGFVTYQVASNKNDIEIWQDYYQGRNMHHVITGTSPRGTCHALIGKDGYVFFDTHPSNDGLIDPTDNEPWLFEHIVKL